MPGTVPVLPFEDAAHPEGLRRLAPVGPERDLAAAPANLRDGSRHGLRRHRALRIGSAEPDADGEQNHSDEPVARSLPVPGHYAAPCQSVDPAVPEAGTYISHMKLMSSQLQGLRCLPSRPLSRMRARVPG